MIALQTAAEKEFAAIQFRIIKKIANINCYITKQELEQLEACKAKLTEERAEQIKESFFL